MENEEYIDDDDIVYDNCPKCLRSYDDVDYDYQACSRCGWDAENNKYEPKYRTKPYDQDFLNGDADVLTGKWY